MQNAKIGETVYWEVVWELCILTAYISINVKLQKIKFVNKIKKLRYV